MTREQVFPCERCGFPLIPGILVCPNCRALVYRRRLEELATDALRVEAANPHAAALIWRQALDLLPPDAAQAFQIRDRIGRLTASNFEGAAAPGGWPAARHAPPHPHPMEGIAPPATTADVTAQPPPADPWPLAAAKTFGSMLVSILCYIAILWKSPLPMESRVTFAVGLTALILVHEMGHVFAMWHYRLSASPPIFIPFLGAFINMRQPPPNAGVESVVGIGGPLLGTIGTLAVLAVYKSTWVEPGSNFHDMLGVLVWLSALLNLFNLLPFPPLDGGRITAALSPWLWLLGLAGLVVLIWIGLIGIFIGSLILFFGLPRVLVTLQARRSGHPYFDVDRRLSWGIGIVYVALAAILVAMVVTTPRPFFIG